MGYMRHHAIVVTSWSEESLEKAHKKAEQIIPGLVSNIVNGKCNGVKSFCILPDGSKEGWDESDIGDQQRDIFIKWINKQRYEDGSSDYDWIEIRFGGDDEECKILRNEKGVKLVDG